jgi:hypothetical protein
MPHPWHLMGCHGWGNPSLSHKVHFRESLIQFVVDPCVQLDLIQSGLTPVIRIFHIICFTQSWPLSQYILLAVTQVRYLTCVISPALSHLRCCESWSDIIDTDTKAVNTNDYWWILMITNCNPTLPLDWLCVGKHGQSHTLTCTLDWIQFNHQHSH